MQIAEHYDHCHTRLLVLNPNKDNKSHPWRHWPATMRLKAIHFRALAHYEQAKATHDKGLYGEEVARLKVTKALCDSVVKLSKQVKQVSIKGTTEAYAEIGKRLADATTANNSTFFEKVVPEEKLDAIQPIAAAKAIMPESTETIADIFAKLVPMTAHLAASEFSEEKAKLARAVNAELDAKNVELEAALKKMGLESGAIQGQKIELPPDVFQKGATLRDPAAGVVPVENNLQENTRRGRISTLAMDSLVVDASTSPTQIQQAAAKIKASVAQACRLDQEAGKILAAIKPDLTLMAGPVDELRQAVPTQQAGADADQVAATKKLKGLLEKVKLLRRIRAASTTKFRQEIAASDITNDLVGSADTAALIASTISHHNKAADRVRDNLKSQDKLLPAIIEANANCSAVRQASEINFDLQRQFVAKLLESFVSFGELKAKVENGKKFYLSLDKTVADLKKKIATLQNQQANDAVGNPFVEATPLPAPSQSQSEAESPLDVAISEFEARYDQLCQRDGRGMTGFNVEWDVLQEHDVRTFRNDMCSVGLHPVNKPKNRYNDILPLDVARVRMKVLEKGANDYVNASFLKSLLPGSPDYIACQGPTPETSGDFWKMLKQQSVRVIVMVTNCVEGGRLKCEQYWPEKDGVTRSFPETPQGNALDITRTGEQPRDGWVERSFTIVEYHKDNTRSTRHVMQFHFTVWPDRGVPDSPVKFIKCLHACMAIQFKFSAESKAAGEPKCPLLVHCSAGVGRTGTFCAIYSTLNSLPMLGRNGVSDINVKNLVTKMRTCRRYMIQSLPQYEFTYRTILHAAREFQASYKERTTTLKKASGQGMQAATSQQRAQSPPGPQKLPTRAVPQVPTTPKPSSAQPQHTAAPPKMPLRAPLQPSLPPARPVPSCIRVQNRSGNCSFLNGVYMRQNGIDHDGKRTFRHLSGIPHGYGAVSNKPLMISYNSTNKAWVIATELGSASVLAFVQSLEESPTFTMGNWQVTEASGYQPDFNMRAVESQPPAPTMSSSTPLNPFPAAPPFNPFPSTAYSATPQPPDTQANPFFGAPVPTAAPSQVST